MECTGDKHVEFISFSCPGLFVMVCPCTFPYLRTRTDILMDTGNFISGLTECTGDKHYKCITRWKISFETLTHFSHSRAAPSQLKSHQDLLFHLFVATLLGLFWLLDVIDHSLFRSCSGGLVLPLLVTIPRPETDVCPRHSAGQMGHSPGHGAASHLHGLR